MSLPLRNLDEHDERCDYKPLMCDLCDMEETEKDEELYGVGKENGDPKETV